MSSIAPTSPDLTGPKMLPLAGERFDGHETHWPKCVYLDECRREIGSTNEASCPRHCGYFSRI